MDRTPKPFLLDGPRIWFFFFFFARMFFSEGFFPLRRIVPWAAIKQVPGVMLSKKKKTGAIIHA